MKTIIFTVSFGILVSLQLYAQKVTNVEKLNQLSEQYAQEWELKQARVADLADRINIPIRMELENGRIIQLVDVVDGMPQYITTTNLGAAQTTRASELWEGGSTGINIFGEGYDKLGEWDGGKVRTTHVEFNDQGTSRVTQMDNTAPVSNHATHVAGTLVAAGLDGNARGMAYGGMLKAWDWNSDLSEMASAAANGLEISNHSYSYTTGWNYNGSWTWNGNPSISPVEDYKFGFYGNLARNVDIVAYNAPNYLITVSAANDRGDGPSDAGQNGNPEKDGGDDGFDCLPNGYSSAKNVLTIGAVEEVAVYTGPESVMMSNFSSWGPADDGRIKPDVVAKGVDVYSAFSNSNTAYGFLSGTSMSSPNTAGTMALLQNYYQSLNDGTPMRASTLKALVIHTAEEAGPNPGPDYMFGWGLVNAEKAVAVIADDQGQNVIDVVVLEQGETFTREINVPEGLEELRITVCWTDPAGFPVPPQLDPLDPMIINDLDLYIEDEGSNMYYPYKLNPLDPAAPATNNSKNYVDNVEMVLVSEPIGGTYTIHLGHEGSLSGGEQVFSIVITGIDEYSALPQCAAELAIPENGATEVLINQWISWDQAPYASSYDVYFGTDGEGTEIPTNILNGDNVTTNGFEYLMNINTTYYLHVVSRNSNGVAEGCDVIWSFTTMDAISDFPYVEDIEGIISPEIPEFWHTQNFSELEWLSTSLTSHTGNNAMGCYNSEGLIETEMDNWFVSPPFYVENGMVYPVTFYYRNFIPSHSESISVYWGNTPETSKLSNLLFEAANFSGSGWFLGEGMLMPQESGVVFLGFHAASPDGYGVFIDDITIETGTTTGVTENTFDEIKVLNNSGQLTIIADEKWFGAELSIVNLMGQVVYTGEFKGTTSLSLNQSSRAGLYFVSLRSEKDLVTRKVIITDY
jgi:hypothetical protein